MARPLFLAPVMLICLLGACALLHRSRDAPAPSEGRQEEFGRELQELMARDEKTFHILVTKMDEYQNLLVLCDGITTGKEEKGIAAACGPKLKELKQELDDLSSILRRRK